MPTVTLLSHTPEPERVVAAAAKLCYSPARIAEIMDALDDTGTASFVRMLAKMGHESPIEHASFTFGIEGVSRALLAQITRHRIGSFSVQSQRYVSENSFDYIIPPEIEAVPTARALFMEAMAQAGEYYNKITAALEENYIGELSGVADKAQLDALHKKAIEDARFVLPNACETKMILTMNARSLLNFFCLRCCNRAQWEIRELANEMLRLVYEKAPAIFENAGPGCVRGGCPEGKMTCGKPTEVRAFYGQLKAQTLQKAERGE